MDPSTVVRLINDAIRIPAVFIISYRAKSLWCCNDYGPTQERCRECKELRPSTITSGKWQRNPVSESVVMCRFVGAGVPFPLLFFLVLHHATLEIMHHHHRFNNFFRPTISCCFPKFHLDGNHRLTYRTRTQSQKIYEMRCPNVGVTAMRT